MSERRYGQWAGNQRGQPENPKGCVKGVYPAHSQYIEHQCSRKRGHGPDGLYCKQHAKKQEDPRKQ